MSTCLIPDPADNTPVTPVVLPEGGGGGGGGEGGGGKTGIVPTPAPPPTSISESPGIQTSYAPTITLSFESSSKTPTLMGFEGHGPPTAQPKKYGKRTISGSLSRTKVWASTTCNSTYPGAGTQSGTFPVFFFFNEYALGTVTLSLNSVVAGVANYTLTAADWSEVEPTVYLDRETAVWRPVVNLGLGVVNVSVGYNFNVAVGTIFSAGISINAVFGVGIGAFNYEAGVDQIDDTWDVVSTFGGSTTNNSQRVRNGVSSAITSTDPETFYAPVFPEGGYVTSNTLSDAVKTVTGNGCVINTTAIGSQNASGTVTISYSEEDTDAAAIARATATPGSSNTARYSTRNSGEYTFTYETVNAQIDLTGLQIGLQYRVAVSLTKSDYDGSNPVADTVNIDFTASSVSMNLSTLVEALLGKKVVVNTATIMLN